MVDPELLEILVCPETRQPVHEAEPDLVRRLNAAITAGSVKNAAGEPVREPVEGGLVREDRRVVYPVREGIPIMLIDEAIGLAQLS
jgi:uncharacterized protein YbaR (Trm112 family)